MTEWQAKNYHAQSTLQQTMAEEQLGRLTLQGDERVLDVGCGDGRITAKIAGRVPRGSVVGVDPSQDMIAFASSQFAGEPHANLKFEVADARSLPFREEFDLAVSFNALHWVPEQAAALDSIRTALRSRGRAQLRFVPRGARKSLEAVLEEVRNEPRWAGSFTEFRTPHAHFTPEEYRTLAERAGFEVVRLHVDDNSWDFKSRDGFAAFGRATFVYWTARVHETERENFITEVLDRYRSVAASIPQDANTFKFYQMEVELRKNSA